MDIEVRADADAAARRAAQLTRRVEAVGQGRSAPLGATVGDGGVNFSVFSKRATLVELCLFDRADDAAPARVIALEPRTHRSYHYWHAFVAGIAAGQHYAYRAHGAFAPSKGLRFDPTKSLLDPYSKAVAWPVERSRDAAAEPGDNAATALKSVVVDPSTYDWENDAAPRTPFARSVIYELHVGGFTRHPSSGVIEAKRGTFAGVVEKIPYLKSLGVTAVELLPVFAFDEQAAPPGLVNYWGYQPLVFFAPHPAYSVRRDPIGAVDEFRDMVKALHRAGIEVILDVVYNHTAEGDVDGPTLSLRGLGNDTYYLLEPDGSYADYSGCGNTLNANESIVRRLILDSLRYWAVEMHVDGFRFDLAAVLSRDALGQPMLSPPIIRDIESDPAHANVKLIAEAWDAGGLYQVGGFAGETWKEWNGKFRDDVRAFVRGDRDTVRSLACRLTGSPDVYAHQDREPEQSINFVACHDGFTLNDLVSYDVKHNEANGEANRDGTDDNRSWNCGVEGPTDDPAIEALRNRQVKNFLALTLLAVGTPMLLAGDEVRRTQHGNNNAYCHDDATTWFDWTLLDRHADVLRFTKELIAFRLKRRLPIERLHTTLAELLRDNAVQWHGVGLGAPDWGEQSHSLAATTRLVGDRLLMHAMVNAYWEPLEFQLPDEGADHAPWRRCIDTALPSPDDICSWDDAPAASARTYTVGARSITILVAAPLDRSHTRGDGA
jgi:glycogen operon protein